MNILARLFWVKRWGLVCLLTSALSFDASAQPTSVQETFERFAASIEVFNTPDFLYDRPLQDRFCKEPCQGAAAFQQYLEMNFVDPAQLKLLLTHADPKVRTLALTALFDQENPRFLPEFATLLEDPAATFPVLQRFAMIPGIDTVLPTVSQTVGDFARQLLDFYLKPAGYAYGPEGRSGQPGFKEYWQQYGESSQSASWLKVRLARASQGTSPTPSERIKKIKQLRKYIDLMSVTERPWIFLFLYGDAGSDALITETELVNLLGMVGRDKLLRLLSKENFSSDPALQSRPTNNYDYHRMCLFVLRHATRLLKAEDAEMLLAREEWERQYQEHHISDPLLSAWWPIAAAHLKPQEADQILLKAFERFADDYSGEERVSLAVALWRLSGEPRKPFILDWFFREKNTPGNYGLRASFLKQLAESPDAKDTSLLRAIVSDSKLDTLSWRSLQALVELANTHQPTPLVTFEEFQEVHHPSGIDLLMEEVEQARQQYPLETQKLLDKLADWRQRLKAAFGGPAPGAS